MEDIELHSEVSEVSEAEEEAKESSNDSTPNGDGNGDEQTAESTESAESAQPASWLDTAYKVGETALFVADFLGEVFAEFFGMTQSRYQWAIDAYERQQRWEREDREKEAYHKKLALEAMRKSKEEMRRAQAEMN